MTGRFLCRAIALLLSLALVIAVADAKLLLVQFLHRHGARGPLGPETLCPTGCGLLNSQGEDQLLHVGSYLRNRYGALVPSLNYDTRVIRSRSTDLDRTLQSASALLKGLFPNTTSYVPAIHTVEFMTDTLLLVDALPAYHVPATVGTDMIFSVLAPVIEGLGFNQSLRQALGSELGIAKFCTGLDGFSITNCVLTIQDVAACYNSDGTLANYPIAQAQLPNLQQARAVLNAQLFPYNSGSELDAARGSLGQNVVQEMLANMRQVMSGTWPTPERVMMHYSAHDTTVMPFCATLGNNAFMLPPFGQTYVLELHNESGSFFVRAVQGVPGQQPSNHSVSESDFPLHCISADGAPYTVHGDIGCLFADFERFVDSSLPQNAAGLCYVSESVLASTNCTDSGVDAHDSLCRFYRGRCPAFACPVGSLLNSVTFSCNASSVNNDSTSTGVVAAVSVSAAIGGVLLGFVLSKWMLDRRERKEVAYTGVNGKPE